MPLSHVDTSEVAILSRVLEPDKPSLSPQAARDILAFDFSPDDKDSHASALGQGPRRDPHARGAGRDRQLRAGWPPPQHHAIKGPPLPQEPPRHKRPAASSRAAATQTGRPRPSEHTWTALWKNWSPAGRTLSICFRFRSFLRQLDPLVQRQSAAWYPIGYGVGQGERPLPNSLAHRPRRIPGYVPTAAAPVTPTPAPHPTRQVLPTTVRHSRTRPNFPGGGPVRSAWRRPTPEFVGVRYWRTRTTNPGTGVPRSHARSQGHIPPPGSSHPLMPPGR